ncbi:hypothetical protein EVAR_49903_1 [Eumeta japonica]|uniref:Uncharacterized protein n=1 Tax=Eumeta variegata TaxID=151549 RepID=A0A4C1Y063_EUMVA|nr:hypothetical protein EVAR_49903_1 [Eumeta japonica]
MRDTDMTCAPNYAGGGGEAAYANDDFARPRLMGHKGQWAADCTFSHSYLLTPSVCLFLSFRPSFALVCSPNTLLVSDGSKSVVK